MQSSPDADRPRPSRWRRVLFRDGKLHPLWRAGLYLAVALVGQSLAQIPFVAVYAVAQVLRGADPQALASAIAAGELPPGLLLALAASGLLWTLAATWAFCRWLDRRPFVSLGFARQSAGKETLAGLALGLVSMAAALMAFLAFTWAQVNAETLGLPALGALGLMAATLAPAAAVEEIVFRGYLLQTLEEWRGWPLAAAGSSALFALAHASNPNVTGLALANIALAGLAFALAYRLTRRLWLPTAYHFMWNYAQGPVIGFPVSGLDFGALLSARVAGPELWTGGAFGPEGGLVVTAILAVTLAGLWLWGRRAVGRGA